MDEAESLCDRLAILDHGKILRSGTPAELIAIARHPQRRRADVRRRRLPIRAPSPAGSAAPSRRAATSGRFPTTDPKTLLPRLLSHDRERTARIPAGARAPRNARRCFPPAHRTQPARLNRMTRREFPNPFTLLWRQFKIEWRLYLRDRGAMFWTFAFPLLMLFGFGLIFRSGGPPALTLVRVAPAHETARDRAFLKALEEARLKVVTPRAQRGRRAVGEGRDDRAARERRRRIPAPAQQLSHRAGTGRRAGREPGLSRGAGAAERRARAGADSGGGREPRTRALRRTTRRSSCPV